MNIWEARLNFRPRSNWEALDLGTRLFQERPFLYMGLWATFSLPLYLVLTAVLWQNPFLAGVLIWWLKPLFEGPILAVMSQQVFEMPPSYRECVRLGWKRLFRPRLLGDLTWRRLSFRRTLVLPVTMLEGLSGKAHQRRCNELSRQSGASAAWLGFFGIHFEMIVAYGLLVAVFWLWFDNPAENVVGHPFSNLRAMATLEELERMFDQDEGRLFAHVLNAAYALLLCFWGPLFTACGFTLYLNTRTRAEGWDIRLAARKIQERLAGSRSALWGVLLAVLLGIGFSGSLEAKNLPDRQQVEQVREQVLNRPPFPHIGEETEYCWRSCDKSSGRPPSLSWDKQPGRQAPAWFNAVMYALVGLLLAVVLWLLLRWYRENGGFSRHGGEEVPETLFGMKITPESLPDDVAAAVLAEYERDPRAALSLLYRASLSQVGHRYGLPLRASDTEGQVLKRVRQRQPQLLDYWRLLTDNWVALAYAHRQPGRETVHELCRQYRAVLGRVPLSGSLPAAGKGGA